MIPVRPSGRVAAAFAALVAALAIGAAPAAAKVLHRSEGIFNSTNAPGGALGEALAGAAVDQATGAVYVLESKLFESGNGVVDKFDGEGAYAGVQITGAATPQGSFSFGLTAGVAVDNSLGVHSGDVYVADTEHHVVDRFSSAGAYECQITGSATPSASECDGLAGSETPHGSIRPMGVAVDSLGDLYVADDAHTVIDKFGPAGNYIGQIEDPHLKVEMATIAVDASGNLYVSNVCLLGGCEGGNVVEFDAAGAFVSELVSSEAEAVAVDPATNNVYVVTGGGTSVYEPSGNLRAVFAKASNFFSFGVAIDGSSGKIYETTFFSAGLVAIFGREIVLPDVTTGAATNVKQTSATLTGHVDPDTAHGGTGVTECEFEYVTDTQFREHPGDRYEGAATASCAPAVPYAVATDVGASIALAPSTTYHFRLKAADADGTEVGGDESFATFGPPTVEPAPTTAAATTATLRAEIDPFGYDTTCHVQYVDEADFKSSGYAAAKTLPCEPADLTGSFGGRTVSAAVSGLQLATTYHFRFTVTNQAGTTTGADETLTTFGINRFTFKLFNRQGQTYTQAGGHPYRMVVDFGLTKTHGVGGGESATGNIKDVMAELPPGLVGQPTATPKCTHIEFEEEQCSGATQVGILHLYSTVGEFEAAFYNVVPPPGMPAQFGARIGNLVDVYVDANVRSGGDYGITGTVAGASTGVGVTDTKAEFWGVPADPSHDPERRCPVPGQSPKIGCPSTAPPTPFLMDPTSCSVETARLRIDPWQEPGVFSEASYELPAFTGCTRMSFIPSISVLPDTSAADTPSGVLVKLHIPQSESKSLEALSTPDLRKAVVTLPAGVTVNPAAANGLQACSPAQIGLDNAEQPTCPDASKIGSLEIETPLLPDTLKGPVYLAEQDNNPFGSLLALYVTAQADGVLIKVPGKVELDPLTGQLLNTFDEIPQLPFSDFRLHFFGGPRAPLSSPKVCGSYQTTSVLTPWSAPESGPPVFQATAFQVTSGPNGAPCASPGFSPGFTGGTTSNQAGGFSSFTVTMSRADGEQNLGSLSTRMPPGLVGMLANVPLCPEPQASEGACPAASEIGHLFVAVGAGNYPLLTPQAGRPLDPIFLTGPYRGAPFGLSIVVPAEAGPFDLNENGKPVVVRGAINVDPTTAQVTVTSDPIPQILRGVPLDVRDVNVLIDRPEFILNPTSCEKMQIGGALTSAAGATSALAVPFQATNCAILAFKPQFNVGTSGRTSRKDGASLSVRLSYPQGSLGKAANIRSVKVELPKQLPARLITLQKACPDSTFAANPAACPAASRVGFATASTPIIAGGFSGPAYFVSHGGAKFPELIIVLQGHGVTVDLHGETYISNRGITSSTFAAVPDVPVSSFELDLPEGSYSALAANGNLCKSKLAMPTEFVAQNGETIKQRTKMAVSGCPKAKRATHRKKKAKRKAKRSGGRKRG